MIVDKVEFVIGLALIVGFILGFCGLIIGILMWKRRKDPIGFGSFLNSIESGVKAGNRFKK